MKIHAVNKSIHPSFETIYPYKGDGVLKSLPAVIWLSIKVTSPSEGHKQHSLHT